MVGGDQFDYESDSESPATNMLETKNLFTNVRSDAKDGTSFYSMNLKDTFLHTLMHHQFKYFPGDIRQKYDLY